VRASTPSRSWRIRRSQLGAALRGPALLPGLVALITLSVSMRARVAVFVATVGVLVGGAIATASTAGTLRAGSHQQLVDQVLARVTPGDHGRILRGSMLQIVIPRGLGSPRRANYTPVWRAGLAAQELALELPGLRRWSTPGNGTDSFANVQPPRGISHLDSLSLPAARRQLAANLQVLAAGLPASARVHVRTSVIPLALYHRRFAFDITIFVDHLGALHHYYGDLALGPGTGLTGRGEPIEGVAVSVHDADGHQLGAWSDAREDGGAIDYGPGDGCFQITLPFRDRHGRPPRGACHG
jgi:hypothetical protein